jgi:ferric-dicitrate binding protein FerR (iron transport regulator)
MELNEDLKDELLARFFLDSALEEDKIALDEWINDSPENALLYKDIKKIKASIKQLYEIEKVDSDAGLKRVRQLIRKRNRPIELYRIIRNIAAALFIPLMIYNALYTIPSKKKIDYASLTEVTVPKGVRSKVTLPDGSTVWMNSGSKLQYPVNFNEKTRNVKLSGEAFFEVKKNPAWPFKVEMGRIGVIVKGTSFSCMAYPEENIIETTVLTGKVGITSKGKTEKEFEMLLPNAQLIYYKKDNTYVKKVVDASRYMAWRNGKLVFNDEPFAQVIRKINNWFNVKIEIQDKELLDYKYKATFENESLYQILELLKMTAPIQYRFIKAKVNEDGGVNHDTIIIYKRKKGA